MPAPLVSIVIPTFNYGHLVEEAIESALNQTYSHREVIVIDDGSTDDTCQRLEKYADRIRYFYQPNAGLSAARNTGITLASGDLIAFLDSDDAYHPRKLELQANYLEAHPAIALIATEAFSDAHRIWQDIGPNPTAAADVTLSDIVLKSHFAPSSVVVRREVFDRVGYFDTELKSVEDRDMWIRIAIDHRMAMLRAPLTWYRLTPDSMSKNAFKMEHFEQLVLDSAFDMPLLENRWTLRNKSYGLAAFAAAHRYYVAAEPLTAARRMLTSFLWWPVPVSPPAVRVHFARVRLLAAIFRKMLFGPLGRQVEVPRPLVAAESTGKSQAGAC